jgi:hypothetical protein
MCDIASKYYSGLFTVPDMITRPHPHTDASVVDFNHIDENTLMLPLDELRESLIRRNLKRSENAHGISPFMLKSLHESHSKFFLTLYNRSLSECFHSIGWTDTYLWAVRYATHRIAWHFPKNRWETFPIKTREGSWSTWLVANKPIRFPWETSVANQSTTVYRWYFQSSGK